MREPAVVTLGSQIIARWLGLEPQSATPSLPRLAETGPSFETLVRSVTNDIRPRAVLDEWLRQGIVQIDDDQRVTLTAAAYVPDPGSEAQLFFFGRNLHDRLSPPVAPALEAAARLAAETVTREINAAALRPVDGTESPPEPGKPTRRVNFGVYLYVEDEPHPGTSP